MDTALFNRVSALHHAVRELQPNTKKALYSSAMGNVFNRSTWNGCALNKASNGNAASTHSAAAYFGEPFHNMRRFILAWDSFAQRHDLKSMVTLPEMCSVEQQTLYLIDIIEQVGLDSTPDEARQKKFIFTLEVHKKELDVEGWLASTSPVGETETAKAQELLFANA